MTGEIKYASVDVDSLEFLKAIYFGAEISPYSAAANRAYLDMNRTIRFNGLDEKKRKELHDFVCDFLKIGIKKLEASPPRSQGQYDTWHCSTCELIQKEYTDAGICFFIGQSQKWLNMTMKYLYIIGACDFDGYFEFLHIPLDNYIFDISKREIAVSRPERAWSRMENYEEEYLAYEKKLREAIGDVAPLRWEFQAWLKEARKRAATLS